MAQWTHVFASHLSSVVGLALLAAPVLLGVAPVLLTAAPASPLTARSAIALTAAPAIAPASEPAMDLASEPATPSYEVKLYMDPTDVLNPRHGLTREVRSAFALSRSSLDMGVQYLDTNALELDDAGWSVRIRQKEDDDRGDYELTYKLRYPIVGGNIDAALEQAAADGFDADEEDYEAEVEWGYETQTLSLSNKKAAEIDGYDLLEMPSEEDSIDAAIDQAPGRFDDWRYNGWGTDTLADARVYGPVEVVRAIGVWSGLELFVETWKVITESGAGYEYLVEVSFKTDNRDVAGTRRAELEHYLSQKGWLLPMDVLKTALILERY